MRMLKEVLEMEFAGTEVIAREVAPDGTTVTVALVPAAEGPRFAPMVTEPASTPVKFAVYTPDPRLANPPKVPVPPTVLEVN